MSFEKTYNTHTRGVEGGYANNPKDVKGGETFRGISRKNHPEWEGWTLVDDIKATLGLTTKMTYGKVATWKTIDMFANRDIALKDMVVEFYRDKFYRTYVRPEIPERLRDKMFDTAVNTGHGNAVRILQKALNCLLPAAESLAVDGALGPKTLAAIERVPFDKLLIRYVTYNLGYYEEWLKTKVGREFWDQREAFFARARWLPAEE
jgi:lysozyme family protein